jgi:hypothetical protein
VKAIQNIAPEPPLRGFFLPTTPHHNQKAPEAHATTLPAGVLSGLQENPFEMLKNAESGKNIGPMQKDRLNLHAEWSWVQRLPTEEVSGVGQSW